MVDDLAFVGDDLKEIQSVMKLVDRDFRLEFALMHHPSREVIYAHLSTADIAFDVERVANGIRIEL